MYPDCCGNEMVEVESSFMSENGQYELVGVRCLTCNRVEDLNGQCIEEQLHYVEGGVI